jgi:hypothetical protein
MRGSPHLTIRYIRIIEYHDQICLYQSSSYGFQRRTCLFLWIPKLSPCLSCFQLINSEEIYSQCTLNLHMQFKKAVYHKQN